MKNDYLSLAVSESQQMETHPVVIPGSITKYAPKAVNSQKLLSTVLEAENLRGGCQPGGVLIDSFITL